MWHHEPEKRERNRIYRRASLGAVGTVHGCVRPNTTLGWASILGLGLGPVGLAFYVWNIGVKRGDIQLLGTGSYEAPVLSTVVLVAAGSADPSWVLALSALLITGGAALAARASLHAGPEVPRD